MEDPAEIAALAQEFITSLDNLPQEVGHLIKEIEHKEGKAQDLLPRIEARQRQLRDVLTKGGSNLANPGAMLPEPDRAKAEKLQDKIKADFDRVEELSAQKEALAIRLWREMYKHSARLKSEMEKISPGVLASFASANSAPIMPALSGLPAALAGLREADGGLKRKSSAMLTGANSPSLMLGRGPSGSATPRGWRQSTPTQDSLTLPSSINRGSPAAAMRGRKMMSRGGRGGGGSGLSNSARGMDEEMEMDADGELDLDLIADPEDLPLMGGAEPTEKDETPYCFCQRVSFGEMIGCDGPDCKFEWFHIGCVGVSKPLPNTWYCDDCKDKPGMKKKKKA